MIIGLLQCGHIPDSIQKTEGGYNEMYSRFLQDQGFTIRLFSVVDMEFPKDHTVCDGWLVTGSRHGAYEDHAFIPPLEDFIRAAFEADVPMVGVCFGHQIIAQALGGKVEKFEGGWAVGSQDYDLLGETVRLNAWHKDQVVTRPDSAKPVASNPFCENAALLYGNKAFTVQPHPEFESTVVEALIDVHKNGVVPSDLIATAQSKLNTPNENKKLANMVAHFFRERALS